MTFENGPAILRSWSGGEVLDSFSCRSDVVGGTNREGGAVFVVFFFVVGLRLEGNARAGGFCWLSSFVVLSWRCRTQVFFVCCC